MKFQDSSFNGLKVTVGTKSVTHARTHAPKAICPINFFKVGGITTADENKMFDMQSRNEPRRKKTARKPVFGVSDQVQHKPSCAVAEDG